MFTIFLYLDTEFIISLDLLIYINTLNNFQLKIQNQNLLYIVNGYLRFRILNAFLHIHRVYVLYSFKNYITFWI